MVLRRCRRYAHRLTPKAFAFLRCLVEDAGRLATRSELIAAVWAETCPPPEVLNCRIADIRGTSETEPGGGPATHASSLKREHCRRLIQMSDVLLAVSIEAHGRTTRE